MIIPSTFIYNVKVQPVNRSGFIINVLVNLRTGTLLISTITVLIAVEEIPEYNNVYIT